MGAEYAEKTRELVLASDKVMVAMNRWQGNPTPEHYAALLAAKVEYLESEVALGVFMRERLETRVKALEAKSTAGGGSRKMARPRRTMKRRGR